MFGHKWSVIFEITDTCNLKCSFCYEATRRQKKHVGLETFAGVLRKYRPRLVQLTGGEPTMHPRFEELASLALERVPFVQMTTNGTLLRRRLPFFAGLRKKPILSVSLDAVGDPHDAVRKHPGLFREIEEMLPAYRQAGVPVGLSCTIFGKGAVPELPEGNLQQVPSLVSFAERMRVPVNFQPAAPAPPELRRALGELLRESRSNWLVNSGAYRRLLVRGHNGVCRYTWTNVSVGTDGNPMPTRPGNCYFCSDCRACFYSCVWEPTLLTSVHFLPAALHHLRTYRRLRE